MSQAFLHLKWESSASGMWRNTGVSVFRAYAVDIQSPGVPIGGPQEKTPTAWTRQLLHRAEVFVGEGDAAWAAVFEEHAHIAARGLHAVVNVPLLDAGRSGQPTGVGVPTAP